MDFLINLNFDLPKARGEILKAMVRPLNNALFTMSKRVERRLKRELKDLFINTSTYDSLIGNSPTSLDAHFGFPEGTAKNRVDTILEILSKDISVRRIPVKLSGSNIIQGGFDVLAYKSTFDTILNLPEAIIITKKRQKLAWLEWLLLEGDQIIISTHKIQFGSNFGARSRSGKAIMAKSGTWMVPADHSGTINDNWITRSIDRSATQIQDIINNIFQQEFEKGVFI